MKEIASLSSAHEENKMADTQTAMTYSTAKRQLTALVRKYNQGTRTNLHFNLTISIDDCDTPQMISYTLIMKNNLEDAWEVRRIYSSLCDDIQAEFTQKVTNMEFNLTDAISSRTTNSS